VLRPREYEDGAWVLSIAINDRKAIKSVATMVGNPAGKFGVFCAALLATGCSPRCRLTVALAAIALSLGKEGKSKESTDRATRNVKQLRV
jgi:hypothetical protein